MADWTGNGILPADASDLGRQTSSTSDPVAHLPPPAGEDAHLDVSGDHLTSRPWFKYSESNVSYDTLAAAIRQLAGDDGYDEFVRRLVAMLVVGNTDAHLKNWALIYRDGRAASLAPVYDFHSLTVYRPYRYQPLALSLNGEKVPWSIEVDDFRKMADRIGADPARTADLVSETVSRLRDAWHGDMADEAAKRFQALAEHYSHRLETLPVCRHAD